MNILITGAAGFIGSHLARRLVWHGYNVVGIDNLHHYYLKECKEYNLDLINLASKKEPIFFKIEELENVYTKLKSYHADEISDMGGFKFYKGDIVDCDFLQRLFNENKFDAIVHLAAMAGVPLSTKNPHLYTEVNVDGTNNLLDLAQKNGVKKFVFGSSSSVYGNREDGKVKEDDNITKTLSIYGATKTAGEAMCHAYHNLFGMDVVIARIFGPIYGPFQRPFGMFHQRAINYTYNNRSLEIYGKRGLETAKDSTYIDDTISGLLLCLQRDLKFEIFNIGTSDPKPIKIWIDSVERAMKQKVKFEVKESDKADVVSSADISKAQSILGYSPYMNMQEGVSRQVEIFNAMPERYKKMQDV